MAAYQISNNILIVEILEKGAEITSVYNEETGLEYIWDANPAFWAKTSPVLFPIVGGLKNNTYFYHQKSYQLNRHGFAREIVFKVKKQTETSICFAIESSEATKRVYPFEFEFYVIYSLHENILTVTYTVENKGDELMYFSVGAHPAFKIPLTEDTSYNDWYLEFSEIENANVWPLSKQGLVANESIPFFLQTNKLALTKELFYKDALVFKNLASNSICIQSNKSEHGLTVNFTGFSYMGIWSFKDADFVCIEPWCGIADNESTTQQLIEKEGMIALEKNKIFEASWHVTTF